jgi:mannose-6-phosphate isomerase-like protein (cupin superfamily)
MRLFRSTNLMVNLFLPWPEPRDETRLSPHAHDDFEQISLALEGTFKHHLRYPWVPDKTRWRDDEHVVFSSPSVLVIPARVVHTSQNIGNGVARLVDIFAPPRLDFSSKPGFVLNAAEYPMPAA